MSIVDIIIHNSVTLCLIAGLALLIFTNKNLDKRSNHYFMCFIVIVFLIDIADMADYYLYNFHTFQPLHYVSSVVGYVLRTSVFVMIINIFHRKRKFLYAIWIPIGIITILAVSSYYTHLIFWFNQDNCFERGPLGFLPHIVSGVYGVAMMILLIRAYDKVDIREILVVIYIIISCLFAVLVETITPATFILPGTITVACALYYIILYIDAANAKNLEKRKVIENELRDSRIVLAMTQIRSHFIFNLLNDVSGMCEIDPQKADESLMCLSRYLRSNIDVMQKDGLEYFDKTLEHLEDFITLEQVRFGDRIKYEKDIQISKFMIPPLVLQPLVENAIRHGLLPLRKGGTISIKTEQINGQIYIRIKDDGAGFDISDQIRQGAVGLDNVRFRLKNMIHGELKINSVPGEGTEAIVIVPIQYNKF